LPRLGRRPALRRHGSSRLAHFPIRQSPSRNRQTLATSATARNTSTLPNQRFPTGHQVHPCWAPNWSRNVIHLHSWEARSLASDPASRREAWAAGGCSGARWLGAATGTPRRTVARGRLILLCAFDKATRVEEVNSQFPIPIFFEQ
jgi:hypothetical protein